MAKVKVIQDLKHPRKDGTSTIYVFTVVKSVPVWFNTKISVLPSLFDHENWCIKGNTKEVRDNNHIINKCRSRVTDIMVKYRLKNAELTPELIRKEYLNPSYDTDFYAFWEAEMKNKKDFIADSTYAQHGSVLNKLKQWRPKCFFSEIDKLFLEDYQRLCKKLKNKQSTINKNLKTIKVYINLALQQSKIDKSPFDHLEKVKVRTEIEYLEKFELLKLLDVYRKNLLPDNKQKVLRRYLFSCFTGIRISDSLALTYNNIIKASTGSATLIIKPKKTDKLQKIVRIPLSLPAMEMLCLDSARHDGHVFQVMAEQTVNKYLKGIIGDCGINKRLRFHSARHTFATMFLHEGGKVEVLQQLLGHEDIRYTMIYVHVSDDDKEKQIMAFDKY